MEIKNLKIKKILFITLSNIGDVILTLPALDILRGNYPDAKITVVAGPRPKEIFENNPAIDKFIVYNKRSTLSEKLRLFTALRRERFDMAVDLRNSLFGVLLSAKYKTSPFTIIPKNIRHMKERHLYKIIPSQQIKLEGGIPQANLNNYGGKNSDSTKIKSLYIHPKDEGYVRGILAANNIGAQDKIIVVASGGRSHIKKWPQERFVELTPLLIKEFNSRIILVGDKDDIAANKYIAGCLKADVLDLTAKTTISQLACLLNVASLLITNDSALLHLGSYLGITMVAIFGPTNPEKYGPWPEVSRVVKKDIFCRPCEQAQCKYNTLDCMRFIKAEDVLRQARGILAQGSRLKAQDCGDGFKRILIVRTDRIGDVILSTPVISALRQANQGAYIAMMVSPYAKDIVEGHPDLDEVVIYDKEAKHKGWLSSLRFAFHLKKKRFDLAIILHPTNRAHIVTFLAGIKRRIGYNRKLGFLLTDRIKHTKEQGEKHELEYNLDLIRYLGIEAEYKNPFMVIKPESEVWVEDLFFSFGISKSDRLLAIHPGASCPSKVWPNERFSEVADRLAAKYGFKVLVVCGPKDIKLAQNAINRMRHQAIDLSAKTSLSQLASVLKRCALFISNDSGPVHIASSVGTPVISIFGRKQKGLSPRRWGPVGLKDRFLHKDAGCIKCLAHNCVKEFACLKAITVDDVLNAAESILTHPAS